MGANSFETLKMTKSTIKESYKVHTTLVSDRIKFFERTIH